ncbi:uncharacterized protein V6R79_002640 [Siganus canaliculatus]
MKRPPETSRDSVMNVFSSERSEDFQTERMVPLQVHSPGRFQGGGRDPPGSCDVTRATAAACSGQKDRVTDVKSAAASCYFLFTEAQTNRAEQTLDSERPPTHSPQPSTSQRWTIPFHPSTSQTLSWTCLNWTCLNWTCLSWTCLNWTWSRQAASVQAVYDISLDLDQLDLDRLHSLSPD